MNRSKDKESFGKGDIRGVIAPESANNACAGGAIIPTILFGIPGSGSMALLLGAFFMIGIYPGRTMVSTNLHITLSIIWTLALANVVAAVLCLVATRPLARITTIKVQYVVPIVLTIVLMGAYQSTRHWYDLVLLLLLGIFGWFMKRYGWPRPALLVGFILGGMGERYLYITVEAFGGRWFYDPGVIVLAVIIGAVVYFAFRRPRAITPGDET
jgi:TctA family transporter